MAVSRVSSPHYPSSETVLPARIVGREEPFDGSDEEAIARTLAGDRDAFESVVTRHERAVYALLFRMTGNTDDAQELSQETFLRAYRALHQTGNRRNLRPWILRIASNCFHERTRRPGFNAPTVSLDAEPSMADALPDHRAEDARSSRESDQERDLLRRAVESLRGEAAELFHLHFREEMTVEAIARSTGKRPNTIAVALHRLRQRLKDVIRKDLP